MYGIVNQAIQGLITESYGIAQWEQIKGHANVQVEVFLSNEPYDDEITYNLVSASSEILQVPAKEILKSFGEYWILKTGKEKYGALMEAGGNNLQEFLLNLPNFHGRIMLLFPNLSPPEFLAEVIYSDCVRIDYYSKRKGLGSFVEGLLYGLSKMFNETVEIKQVDSSEGNITHEIFHITIIK